MKPVATSKVVAILAKYGCVKVHQAGSHQKWRTPGGLSITIKAGAKEQSPGLLRTVQDVFAAELGPRWLERELQR